MARCTAVIPGALADAWRSWKRAKGVALLAIVAFAVGIGGTTALFTVVTAVIFRPLPYPDGDRYVSLYGARVSEPGQYMASSVADLTEYEQRTSSVDLFGWFRLGSYKLTATGDPQYVRGAEVTPSLYRR